MFTATKLQAATYLLGVCLFSVRTFEYILVSKAQDRVAYFLPIFYHVDLLPATTRLLMTGLSYTIDRVSRILELVRLVRYHEPDRPTEGSW